MGKEVVRDNAVGIDWEDNEEALYLCLAMAEEALLRARKHASRQPRNYRELMDAVRAVEYRAQMVEHELKWAPHFVAGGQRDNKHAGQILDQVRPNHDSRSGSF